MASYSVKNLKTYALAAAIALFFAACGTGGRNRNVGTFLDGSWWNTGINDNCRILMDGNTWTYYVDNKPVYKGTWTASAAPEAASEGTITFTVTHVEAKQGWVDLSVDYKSIKSCTVNYSIDAEGKQITLSNKKLAAADPAGIWDKLEGVYIKGRPDGSKSGGGAGSGGNATTAGNKAAGSAAGSASQAAAKSLPETKAEDRPFIPYVITGSGSSFSAIRNGTAVIRANQTINDLIEAIINDSAGFNTAIQFGNGVNVLDIGAVSLRLGPNQGGNGGIIALSGKITSSASPAVSVNSSMVTSVADISSTYSGGGGSIIENSGGAFLINGGTVTSNEANVYGIKNSGGTVVINNGNVTPRGEGIYNDSGSGKGGSVFINGGTVHSLSGRAIYNMKGSSLTIAGGTVLSYFSESVYNPGGALKISGGTVSGGSSGHAIWNSGGGNVAISGGTVTLTNIGGSYAAINNDSGCTLTISGGTILAPNNGKAVINASGATVDITSPPAVIKGSVSK